MMAKKWIYEIKSYENYPLRYGAVVDCDDRRLLVDCAECGRVVEFRWMFASLVIQNEYGQGYAVCADCNAEERRRKDRYDRHRRYRIIRQSL